MISMDSEKFIVLIIGAVLALFIVAWFFMFLTDSQTERGAIDRCYKAGGYCKELPRSKCSCYIPTQVNSEATEKGTDTK